MMNNRFDVDLPHFLWIWNRCQGLPTPGLHISIARWLAEHWHRGDRELLLLAFRNSGKSTLVGLFCAWLLFRDPNLRVLALAGDFALAKKMVRNVRRIIERHPLTRHLRPSRGESWASDQFTVRRSVELRDPSMLAKGIAANITGLRADIAVCDDVEVPNTCDTALKRRDLRVRLQEIDYVLVPGGLKLFVGTPHTYYTLYAEQARPETGETRPFLDGYCRLEVPVFGHDGRSRWRDRFPEDKIEAIRVRTGPAKFESQMLLKPRSLSESRLDPERLRVYDAELDYAEGNQQVVLTLGTHRLVSVSCWWDPAFGAPHTGDASVVASVFTDDAGNYRLHRIVYQRHDPMIRDHIDEATQLCRQVAAFAKALYVPAITLETNGLGRFLPSLLRNELRRAGLVCAVIEKNSSRGKHIRILDAFDSVLAAGRLWVHRSVWSTPFIEEMREWRPGCNGRDDGLDAVAGCLLAEPVRLPRLPPPDHPAAALYRWQPLQATTVIDSDGDSLS